MKKCTRCKKRKPVSSFSRDKNRKDGLCLYCKACDKKYYQENRKECLERNKKYAGTHKEEKRQIWRAIMERTYNILEQIKELGCGRCPESDMRALLFHHINPKEKKFAISGRNTSGIEMLIKEIEKCELICANCHLKTR